MNSLTVFGFYNGNYQVVYLFWKNFVMCIKLLLWTVWAVFSMTLRGLPSLNVGTSYSNRGPQMEQLLPLLLFLFQP